MASRDNRRYTGPEKSIPIIALKPPNNIQFLDSNGQRRDKRSPTDVRKIYMGLSNISQAKGSSYVEVGDTKVICGVYGPREMAPSNTFKLTGQVCCEVKLAPFAYHVRRSPVPDRQVKELSTQLKETFQAAIVLEQYPKAQIDVHVTVIEDGGGLLSACINAATLALCDANIHMYDVVVAATLVWHAGRIYLDPSLQEEECLARAGERFVPAQVPRRVDADVVSKGAGLTNGAAAPAMISSYAPVVSYGVLTVGLMPLYASSQVALMVMSGSVTAEQIQEGLESGLEACRKVYGVVKQVLLHNNKQDENDAHEKQAISNGR
uniref:Exosome complex component MTR3-like n=1 Tax=Hirondellea gigas TaxID=1518452 RepID=A0A2P2I820_9CRUS